MARKIQLVAIRQQNSESYFSWIGTEKLMLYHTQPHAKYKALLSIWHRLYVMYMYSDYGTYDMSSSFL